ncbi:hypothetical protein [Paracoccus sp. ME4]|uniref:hypothetical protein n=1 Tax=Paracoccus sp. ME4 TaxID=3138066 RepID=UPI00398ADA2D
MSTEKKAIAKVSVDDDSGVILARPALPDTLEARRKDLLDPASIGAARDGLDNFEDRLSQLNSLSNLFDDDDGDGDALITMGGGATAARPDAAPATAERPLDADMTDGRGDAGDDDFHDDEAVVIGGLSTDDEMMDADFALRGEDDGLLSSFDDHDAIDFGGEDFDAVPAGQPAPDMTDMGDAFFDDEPAALRADVDFMPADEADIARNAQASQIAIDAGEAMQDHPEELHFNDEEDDPAQSAEDSYPDPIYEDTAPASGTVRFETPVVGAEVSQDLGSIVGSRRDRHDHAASAPDRFDADLFLNDPLADPDDLQGPDAHDDLWSSADADDGINSAWDDPRPAGGKPERFHDDFAVVNNETGNGHWDDAADNDAASGGDAFEAGSSFADPTPWAGFGDDTDIPGGSDVTPRAAGGWADEEAPAAELEELHALPEYANYDEADGNDNSAAEPREGADRVRATKDQTSSPDAGPAPEAFDASWMVGADEVGDAEADTPELTAAEDLSAGQDETVSARPAKPRRNIAFIATSAALAALIAGAGYFGAASMGLIGMGQSQPAAVAPVTEPAPVILPAPIDAPVAVPLDAAPVQSEPEAPLETPVLIDEVPDTDMGEDALDLDMGDLFDPEAPAEPVAVGQPEDAPADAGDLSDLAMGPIPDPAPIDTPIDAVDAASDDLEDVALGLSGAAAGDLDALFLPDGSTAVVQEDEEAFDPAMVTDLLTDYATKEEAQELRSAIDLMFEKVSLISEEVTERDERILELEERIVSLGEKATRAETLALAQNEVLVEFVRVKEKVDMAESLIVDLSRRISSMETTDPADRVAVERSLEDIMSRMDSMARDIGLVARVAINGSPEKVRAGADTEEGGVPGSSAVYESTKSDAAAPGDVGKVPSDVKVGDFVEGYGYVLQIMPTSDGSRVVVMENKSILLPN